MPDNQLYLEPGKKLFSEGDSSGTLYHVKQGELLVYRERDGIEVPLETIKTGEFLGTVAVLSQEPRSASVKAISHCLLECYGQEALNQTMESIPKWVRAMLKDIIVRLKRVNEALVNLKIGEKRFYPTPLIKASQICSLLSTCLRAKSAGISLSGGIPLGNFSQAASQILGAPVNYLDPILHALHESEIIDLRQDLKQGACLINPDLTRIDEFSQFALQAHRKGTNSFISETLLPALDALGNFQPAFKAIDGVGKEDLAEIIVTATKGKAPENSLDILHKSGVLMPSKSKIDSYSFNTRHCKERGAFEKACRKLISLSLTPPDKWTD